MTQPSVYEQTFVDILRTVLNSFWPLHERELEQNALLLGYDNASKIALRNVAIPRLRQIFNLVNVPNQLFAELRAVRDQVSADNL